MLLQAVIAAFTVFSFCSNYGLAYNEESPNYKWSPRYLYGRRPSPTIYQIGSGNGIQQRASRYHQLFSLPSFSGSTYGYEHEGSLASRNPGFYGNSRISTMKRSCVDIGEKCYVRAGLLGTMMKLSCCSGSTCTLVGHSFTCMPDVEQSLDDYEFEDDAVKK